MTTTPETTIAQLYRASRTPHLVDVPELTFLMVDGHGDPNTSDDYAAAVAALFAVAYALRFAARRAGGPDEKVGPLEGLWWVPDMTRFSIDDKSDWDWTMMIRVPGSTAAALVERTARDVAERKQLPAARRLRLERFTEGPAAQVLHVGPFAAEGPTVAALHAFVDDAGLTLRGKHHEIYLTDIRRAAPERWKTIVRQPVGR